MDILNTSVDSMINQKLLETAMLFLHCDVASGLFLMTINLCNINDLVSIDFINRKSVQMMHHCHIEKSLGGMLIRIFNLMTENFVI